MSTLNSKLRSRAFPPGPQLQAPDRSVPHRTRTASAGCKCSPPLPAPPILNRKLRSRAFPADRNCQTAVFPAKPEQQDQDESVLCRTACASARSQCFPPEQMLVRFSRPPLLNYHAAAPSVLANYFCRTTSKVCSKKAPYTPPCLRGVLPPQLRWLDSFPGPQARFPYTPPCLRGVLPPQPDIVDDRIKSGKSM